MHTFYKKNFIFRSSAETSVHYMLDSGPISSVMESSPRKDFPAQSYPDHQQNIGPSQNLSGPTQQSGLFQNLSSSVQEPVLGTEHRSGPSQDSSGPIQQSGLFQKLSGSLQQKSVISKCIF